MKKLIGLTAALILIAALLAAPAFAAESAYVYDWADTLSESQLDILTTAAGEISETYGVGVYIATLDDMRDYGYSSVEVCAEQFYKEMELGYGADHTGILLLMSMAGRDYDLCAYGDYAHYAFTDYGKTTISDAFLDNFRSNDWYGGFFDYLARCDEMLSLADAGTPVDVPPQPKLTGAGVVTSALLSLLIAWIVCSILKGRMKSAVLAADADNYVRPEAVQITLRDDRFSHTTTTRRRIERSGHSGGGGTSVNSGGFSHSSGKF